jgi:hypothetical protein
MSHHHRWRPGQGTHKYKRTLMVTITDLDTPAEIDPISTFEGVTVSDIS